MCKEYEKNAYNLFFSQFSFLFEVTVNRNILCVGNIHVVTYK